VTTRAGLRTLVRQELNDTGGTALWSDTLLNQWIVQAIREYSERLPKAVSAAIATVANQADYALPADCQRVLRVEHPTGFFRVLNPRSGGDVVDPFLMAQGTPRALSSQLVYDEFGPFGAKTLTLTPAPTSSTETIGLRYLGQWAEPSADGDTLATPSRDDQLLVWMVCSAALQWIGTDESKRQRFERQRGVSAVAAGRQYDVDVRKAFERRAQVVAPRRLVVRE
jgi:hypothetical protein